MTNKSSGLTPERIAEILARVRAQSAPSLINPETQTVKEDIEDALVSEKDIKQESPILREAKQVAISNAIGLSKLAELKAKLGISTGTQQRTGGDENKTSQEDGSRLVSQSMEPNRHTQEAVSSGAISKGTDSISSETLGHELTQQLNKEFVESGKLPGVTTDKYGNLIQYNEKQKRFIEISGRGESCVLIGPAGTGKTTCQKGVVSNLIQTGFAGILQSQGHKHLSDGTPGIVICSYTRRAVANIRRNVSLDMQGNCVTIHKLLEYQPVYYTTYNDSGEEVTKMAFEPTRNATNPLPSSIKTIIIEEGSMLGIDLYMELKNACPHNPQFIFLGDIQQLPPVFGPAILGFKLLELPVVELTEVYRQALESPIIRLAHRILSGNPIPAKEYDSWKEEGKLTIRPWKKKIKDDMALNTIALMFCGNKHTEKDPAKHATGLIEAGVYNPEEDMILIPFNKACGTDELNKKIAYYLARQRDALVYEIIAGFNKIYLSVGDKVLYDKEDATVVKIETNPAYAGARPLVESKTLDYWGFDPVVHTNATSMDDEAVDFLLSQVASSETGDRVHAASHIITLNMNDSDATIRIDKAGDINALLLGYALTVHKSQGSEWRKVFCIFHQSHATMLQRELLYTAVTRAREELFIVCEPETFTNGIRSQRVKGDTLAEKAEYFKGRKQEFSDRIA